MRYVAAYMLAVLGGNTNPSVKDIEGILNSVGVDIESEKIGLVVERFEIKKELTIDQLIVEGSGKLATISSGPAVTASPSTVGSAVEKTEAKSETKKEEKKVESESEDEDMGFGLFD